MRLSKPIETLPEPAVCRAPPAVSAIPANRLAAGDIRPAMRTGLAAGIVVFRPSADRLLALIRTIRASVDRVYLFLNGAVEPELRCALTADTAVECIESDLNFGVGVGLNFIAFRAINAGHQRLVLFDQDSRPRLDTVAVLDREFAALRRLGKRPAVVAPRLVPLRDSQAGKAPTYRTRPGHAPCRGMRPVQFVPTSGSLLSLRNLDRVGFFRSDYFVDGIDVEWCLRAWASGQSCWLVPDLTMEHPIGSGVIAWPWLGFSMPKQKPFRMYCFLRNSLYGMRLPHVPLSWKLKQLAYMPVQAAAYLIHHRFRPAVLICLATGILDGLMGRLGLPRIGPAEPRSRRQAAPRLRRDAAVVQRRGKAAARTGG